MNISTPPQKRRRIKLKNHTCKTMCVSVHPSTEHDSCLPVVFVLLKVVSLSALASSVNSGNDAEVSPRHSGKHTSCWCCLQRDSGGVWAPKPVEEEQDETDDKMRRE